ncbi:MAG: hypothetical protein R3Y43_00785 [Alphaproteobacteria bacterium]
MKKNKIEKDSFITEIEEDLKNDNLKKLWDKYGVYLITAMASILLITIVIEMYSYFKTQANQKIVDTYTYAINLKEGNNLEESISVLNELENKGGLVKDLASVEEVNILIEQNKTEGAVLKLETLSKDDSVAPQIKDVAIMMLASHYVDNGSLADVEETLAPLLNLNNAWYDNAREFLAVAQLKAGNKEKSIEIFEEIYNQTLNENIKNRVSGVLSVLK